MRAPFRHLQCSLRRLSYDKAKKIPRQQQLHRGKQTNFKIIITIPWTVCKQRIVDKLNRITDIHALNRIYDCVYRQFLKAGTETTRDFTSVALQIEDGVTMLEAATDTYGVLSDALGELQVGKDELLSIKKAGADHD
jgi:hypothetical protein